MGSETPAKLPVIDFSDENLKPGSDSWFAACKDIRHAFEEYGCFVAHYNQVPLELQNKMFNALGEYFDLPIEVKVKNTGEVPSFGYVGQIPGYPLHESMGIKVTNLEETQSFVNLMWPSGNEHFCEVVHSYASLLAELERLVMRMVVESYGIKKYEDSHSTASSRYLLRLLRNQKPEIKENNIAFPTHTDKSFIAILQQNHVNGLEIDTKDGKSTIAFEPPSPSCFIVMAGDAFMAWSNGRIHSPKHRVIMRGDEMRDSMGLFSFKTEKMQVPEELVDDKHPLQFKPFDHMDFIRFFHTEESRKSKSPITAYCGI